MTDVPAGAFVIFCIAHIDHGKSTLADRLQTTGTVDKRQMKEQFLDNMDLERERGITIKLQAGSDELSSERRSNMFLIPVDTPGRRFSYECRAVALRVKSALLVVDASQGVEAQTLVCLSSLRT